MPDLSIFKLDSQTINIKDTTARQTADSAKTLATTASDNATTALNKINELESEKADKTLATDSANGLMSAADKAKLDGITGQVTADKVNAPDHTTDLVQYGAFQIAARQIATEMQTALNKKADKIVVSDALNKINELESEKADKTLATDSANGLMSATDKAKLDGITGQVTADKVNAPDHTTDLVQYGAFQIVARQITTGMQTALNKKADKIVVSDALNKINELESEISALKSDLANKLYPVGSIYMSVNATNPAELFGGRWEQIKGRFLIGTGANDANTSDYWGHEDANQFNIPAGELGGEAWHTLTVDEMPSHGHKIDQLWTESPGNNQLASGDAGYSLKLNENATTSLTGGGEPHNNMPPYLAVYMWKRTA